MAWKLWLGVYYILELGAWGDLKRFSCKLCALHIYTSQIPLRSHGDFWLVNVAFNHRLSALCGFNLHKGQYYGIVAV